MTVPAPTRSPNLVVALLDACVLFPVTLRDALLRAAEADLFRPLWSADILDELERHLIADARASPASVDRLFRAMRQAFPDAVVTGYRHLTNQLQNHPKDRHVLAAAIVGNANVVVTRNVKDFRDEAVVPSKVGVQTPDAVLCRLLDGSAATMLGIVRDQAATFNRPAFDVDDVIDSLARSAPVFADRVRVLFS